jgi:hypothetical protein
VAVVREDRQLTVWQLPVGAQQRHRPSIGVCAPNDRLPIRPSLNHRVATLSPIIAGGSCSRPGLSLT